MTKATGHQAGKSHSLKSQQWAKQVLSISENTKRGGIEVHFDAEPSPQLQPKLRAMGFRHSRTKSMWYGDRTDQAMLFAERLREVLPTSADGPELLLSPSVKAVKTNLEKKAFSFVLFTLKDGQTKSYVVFEPSKPKAEVIAGNFARKEFGDQLIAMAVLPKTHIREARTLFDEGKIIRPDEVEPAELHDHAIEDQDPQYYKPMPEKEKPENNPAEKKNLPEDATGYGKIPLKGINLTVYHEGPVADYDQGVYYHTWAGADEHVCNALIGKVSDVFYRVTWQDDNTLEGSVDLEPVSFYEGNNKPFSNHVKTYLNNVKGLQRPHPLASAYMIAFAKQAVENYLFDDPAETITPNVKSLSTADQDRDDTLETPPANQRQLESQAIDKFYKWAVQQNDGNMKPSTVTYALMTKWFQEHVPELSLNNISSIWKSHQRILKSLDNQGKFRNRNLRHPFDSIYKKILKIIPGLIEHIKAGKLHGKSRKDPEGGLMNLNYDYVTYDKNGYPIIALSHYFKQHGDMVADPDMQIRLIPDMEIAEALTYQDQFGFKQVYSEQNGKLYVNQKWRKDLNSFLNTWLTNIIHQGHKIDLTAEEEDESNYYRKAWELVTLLVPGLRDPAEKALSGTVAVSGAGTVQQRGIVCTVAQRKNGDYEVSLIDSIGSNDRLHFVADLNNERQTALVSYEWFRAGNARIYGREESHQHIIQRSGNLSEETTKGFIRWLEEVLSLDVTIPLAQPPNFFAEREARNSGQEKALWDLIYKVLPDLKLLPGKELQSQTGIGEDTQHFIHASLGPHGYVGDFSLHLTDTVEGIEQLRADIQLKTEEQCAEVYSIYLGGEQARNSLRKTDQDAMLGQKTDDAHEMNEEMMTWLRELIDKGITITLSASEEKSQTPLSTIAGQTSETLSDLPAFDPFVMARLISSQNYLENAWGLSYAKSVLQKKTFSTEDIMHLRAFYAIYVQEDQPMQARYIGVYRELHTRALDLQFHLTDTLIPNVLVPAGSKEPFYSHDWETYDMPVLLKNDFPGLLALDDVTLNRATPLQLYELMQLGKPDDYGIAVTQEKLVGVWRTRGKEIFDSLGYPTNAYYPYADLFAGYENLRSLYDILNDGNTAGDEWWVAAALYRPIADLTKASKMLDDLIHKKEQERRSYMTANNERPRPNHKNLVERVRMSITNLEESRTVIRAYLDKTADDHSTNVIVTRKDHLADEDEINIERSAKTPETTDTYDSIVHPDEPLANDDGVYTSFSAGNNFEELVIPMPKSSGYRAQVFLVKTSDGNYKEGIRCGKNFGDSLGLSFFPTVGDESYQTRKAALKAALLHHEQELQVMLANKDTILNNEATKHKRLVLAMNTLKQFAKDNGISLKAEPDAAENKEGIIQELEGAYWKNDIRYPVDKITIKGQVFHQARLREAIGSTLEKLPLVTLEQIMTELANRFREHRPFSSYEKGLVTVGKKGKVRKATLIAAYVDDMIVDHDLIDSGNVPVMSFLVDLLFSESPRLVDVPSETSTPKKTSKPMKKQSQYELNREIEKSIDEKDETGAYYDENEKNYLRQYTGSGGLLAEGASGRGTLYEYYTPDGIVKKMWDIAYHYGYDGGHILEPAVGTGNFLKYAPKDAVVFGFETNHYAARIAQILYPNARIFEKAFETHFFAGNIHLKDKFENPGYSLVIGNPPYGAFTGKYAGLGEKQYTGVTEYDQYFTLRSLDLLKPGGLLVFLIPSYFMLSMQKYNKIKERITAKAEWVDAYRFPEGAVPNTNVGTDILVLRKRK